MNILKQNTAMEDRRRRRHKRFCVRKGALAFLGSTTPGKIVDISRGGMSIQYVVFEEKIDNPLKINIFSPEQDFFLADIPASVVSEIDCPANLPFSAVQTKRIGVKFGKLSKEQEASLEQYLLHNTIAEV